MLDSGKQFRASRDKNKKKSNSRVVRKKILNETKNHNPSPFCKLNCRSLISSPDSRNRKFHIPQHCLTPVVILIDSFHQILHIRMFRIAVSPFFVSYLGWHSVYSLTIDFLCTYSMECFLKIYEVNVKRWIPFCTLLQGAA